MSKIVGFVSVLALWIVLTFLCYHNIITFDNTTLTGAMILGLVLTISILGMIRFLKRVYDDIHSTLMNEGNSTITGISCHE